MITRGIIRKVPSGNVTEVDGRRVVDNIYQVEIPSLRTANNTTNISNGAFLSDALLCYQPGNLNSYRVGDVVFLTIDAPETLPIIIGKMYVGDEEATNFSKNNTLEVTDRANLPEDTTIGDVSFKDIKCAIVSTGANGDDNSGIEEEISEINERLDALGFDSASADSSWVYAPSSSVLPLKWAVKPTLSYDISGGIQKEGNFATINLSFTVLTYGEVTSSDYECGYVIKIPERFRPEENRYIYTSENEFYRFPSNGELYSEMYNSMLGTKITAGNKIHINLTYRIK